MRIEQGVKVFECDEGYCLETVFLNTEKNDRFLHVIDEYLYIIKNRDDEIAIPLPMKYLSIETAIKIAKLLNEDLKRGDV